MKPQLEIILTNERSDKRIGVKSGEMTLGVYFDLPYEDSSATSVVEILAAMRDNGMIELTANDDAKAEWKELNL